MRYFYEIAAYMDGVIPAELSESFDSDGIMVSTEESIDAVVCALDCTEGAIAYAKKVGAKLIVTHHPLFFRPPYQIDTVRRYSRCLKAGIGVLSYHTRLDSLDGGVNDSLCNAIGLKPVGKFPCGRICECGELPLSALAAQIGSALSVSCTVVGEGASGRVAVVSGGGKGDIIPARYIHGCNTLVTGEASHSAFIAAREIGLNVICATHHGTERVVLPFLAGLLTSRFPDLKVYQFDFDEKAEFGADYGV